jgi:hypothetical protein
LSQRPSYAALKDEMTESMTEQSERPMGAQGDHGDSYDITTRDVLIDFFLKFNVWYIN